MPSAPTIKYRGHTYSHPQIWALVRALRRDFWRVRLEAVYVGDGDARWTATLARRDGRFPGLYAERRSPWLALCEAIADGRRRSDGQFPKEDE